MTLAQRHLLKELMLLFVLRGDVVSQIRWVKSGDRLVTKVHRVSASLMFFACLFIVIGISW